MTHKARCIAAACPCACHVRRRPRQVPRVWTTRMDAAIVERLVSGHSVREIAEWMHLTPDSITWRLKQLGHSTREGWRSSLDVAWALGVSRRAVARWRADGLLVVSPHGRRWTRVVEADLRAFVATWAGVLFEPDGVVDAALRPLAETSALANRRRPWPDDPERTERALAAVERAGAIGGYHEGRG